MVSSPSMRQCDCAMVCGCCCRRGRRYVPRRWDKKETREVPRRCGDDIHFLAPALSFNVQIISNHDELLYLAVQTSTTLRPGHPNHPSQTLIMSMFGFGGRAPPSSAEKIAAAEAEIEMVSNMFNQYVLILRLSC